MKLIIIEILSFMFAWVMCYGAMRVAERIAKQQTQQVEGL